MALVFLLLEVGLGKISLAYMVGLTWFEFHAGAKKGVFELSSWLPYM